MYAMDKKNRAMIASSDCTNWSIVADSLKAGILDSAVAVNIPGKPRGELSSVTVGGDWTGECVVIVIVVVIFILNQVQIKATRISLNPQTIVCC